MSTSSVPLISQLLQQAATPNGPAQILTTLEAHPELAHAQDDNGYSLLHAAASYNALDLARALVNRHKVDINRPDTDGDTPLFYAETPDAARCLVEELGADAHVRNNDGDTPLSNAQSNAEDAEGEWDAVARYLSGGSDGDQIAQEQDVRAPPPLPPNVRINMGTMREEEAGALEDADPELRRRIEELAGRDDFAGESGQSELRALIEEAVGGIGGGGGASDGTRRRVE